MVCEPTLKKSKRPFRVSEYGNSRKSLLVRSALRYIAQIVSRLVVLDTAEGELNRQWKG